MINEFFKRVFNTGKKAKKSLEDSVDFLDEVLEKEYVSGSLQRIKHSTGEIVESSGRIYQQTKDSLKTENIKKNLEKLSDKGEQLKSEISESMIESSETLKNVMREGKEILDKFFDEEE